MIELTETDNRDTIMLNKKTLNESKVLRSSVISSKLKDPKDPKKKFLKEPKIKVIKRLFSLAATF